MKHYESYKKKLMQKILINFLILGVTACSFVPEPLPVMEPKPEWKGCRRNGLTLGLSDEDFMHLQSWIPQLKHNLIDCPGRKNAQFQ